MANDKLSVIPDVKSALDLVREFTDKVLGFNVVDEQTEHDAQEFSRDLQTALVNCEDGRKGEKAPHLEAGREVDRKWKPALDDLEKLKRDLDTTIIAYKTEQERLAAELERKQEIERLEVERKERERLEKIAQAAEEENDQVGAEVVRDMKSSVAAPAPPPPLPAVAPKTPVKVKGVNVRTKWVAAVRPNQKDLLRQAIKAWNKACDDGDEVMPAAYWMPNQKALDAFADKTKGGVDLDGVRFTSDDSLVSQKRS